jgi:hypothetical protein
MLTCPMCKKKLRGLERECLNCRTDVSLLVDYVENLREGLTQAEALTRQGELGEAVWTYLTVLEVDPDNTTARRQVGKVVTAVRQFDQTAPGRRWLKRLQKQTRFRRWMAKWNESEAGPSVVSGFLWFLLVFSALLVGYVLGYQAGKAPAGTGEQSPPAGQTRSDDGKKPDAAKPAGGEKAQQP